jgi:hypothetical protein
MRACLRNTQRCPRTADRALCDARRRARRERRGEQARRRRRSLRMRLTAHERWRSVRRRPRGASAAAQRQPRTSHQALSPLLNVARICCTGCGRLVSTLTALRAVPSARARAYTDTHRRAKSRSAMRLSATEYSHGYSEYSHGGALSERIHRRARVPYRSLLAVKRRRSERLPIFLCAWRAALAIAGPVQLRQRWPKRMGSELRCYTGASTTESPCVCVIMAQCAPQCGWLRPGLCIQTPGSSALSGDGASVALLAPGQQLKSKLAPWPGGP